MNFRKASIFQRDTEKPEEQNDSGGMLAVWGSPGSGKTITAVKIAKMLSARKKNVILLLCDMAAPMLPCICPADALESKGSLAGVLAAARISENLIKHNLVTFKRNSCLAVLLYAASREPRRGETPVTRASAVPAAALAWGSSVEYRQQRKSKKAAPQGAVPPRYGAASSALR